MKKINIYIVLFMLSSFNVVDAQYKLEIGNFWITNYESYIEKVKIIDTVKLFDSLSYYQLDKIFISKNSKIVYKKNTDTVNGTFIRKLPNGVFEEVTYKNGAPFGLQNYYEYKDNPQLNERWIHRITTNDPPRDTMWASVDNIFEGDVFGEKRKVIEVRYDTGFDYNRFFCDELGAELSETSLGGGEVRSSLIGCYVGGVVYGDTSFKPVSIEKPETLSMDFELEQNYPNPFNPETTILFHTSRTTKVKLVVYNITGQEVAVLANKYFTAGKHQIIFNINNYPNLCSGIYFYRVITESFIKQKKMIYLK